MLLVMIGMPESTPLKNRRNIFDRVIRKWRLGRTVAPIDKKIAWASPTVGYSKHSGMHHSIRYILGIAAVLGTFPVCNITNRSTQVLQFKWFSFVTTYTLLLLGGFIAIEIIAIDYSIQHLNQANLTVAGGFKRATSGTIFYGNACLSCWLFLQLARVWPELAQKWQLVELSMKRFGQPKLLLRLITMTSVFMTLAFAEHLLHNWLNVNQELVNLEMKNKTSNEENSVTFQCYMKVFSLKTHWYLFETHESYATWKGIAILWLSLSGTFIWTFTDLFIMLISSVLAAQFHILNRALRHVRGKMLSQLQWREFREIYASLTHLVKLIDQNINKIIVISVANNVYFICTQLITEIDTIKQNYMGSLFYLYSFLFIVARTTAVVIQAAAIHDESRQLAPELFLCPAECYCIEVQRFLQEVTSDYVCLTGLNMFSITRNFLLGIAGAILTYEIVLIQLQNAK